MAPGGGLKEAVQRIAGVLGQGPSAPSLRLEDEGAVALVLTHAEGRVSEILLCFTDPGSYPSSSCVLSVDAADTQHEALLRLSLERFQDRAPLEQVVQQILNLYGIKAVIPAADSTPASNEEAGGDQHGQKSSDAEDEDMDRADMECDEDGGSYQGMASDGSDADGGSDGGDDSEQEDEEEREMIINCGQRQGRWERWEERVREAEKAASTAATSSGAAAVGLSHEHATAKKQQIFEPREGFMMLSKELLQIFKQQRFDIFVDSVGDDVYNWSVELASFDPQGNLYKDMQEIQKRHQYSFVTLKLRFRRGLHPFYPPSVELVRPHFKGCIATAVSCHPMLKLGVWDPWRPIEEVIKQIKNFLEGAARVDLDHPLNDISRYPVSSYRPVEVLLARLSALSDVDLTSEFDASVQELYSGYSHNQDRDRMDALVNENGKKRKSEAQAAEATKTFWARGTGYGSGDRSHNDPVWDAHASEAAQKARDEELRTLLESLVHEVSHDLKLEVKAERASSSAMQEDVPAAAATYAADAAAAAAGPSSSSARPMVAADALEPVEQTQTIEPDADACLAALSSSCLMAFLVRELKAASFTDMCTRTSYYLAILSLMNALGRHREACKLLWVQTSGGSCAADLVQSMQQSATQYAKVTKPVFEREVEEQKATAAALEAAARSAGSTSGPTLVPVPPRVASLQQETLHEMSSGLELANMVLSMGELLRDPNAAGAGQSSQQRQERERRESGEASGSGSGGNAGYCDLLRPLQVEYLPDLRNMSHAFASTSNEVQPKARMSRLAKEMAGLQQMLPLSESSSIFVRIDEENVTLWRALITGPEDTPYSCGCFIFDFYFPPNYPAIPPQVQFKTTGGGRIRFNPNLYNNGKVCLSLLGTWSGNRGEGWNPTASSALQVLLSIQSLILVPHPYFNEPGYERTSNTEEGKKKSREYNQEITEGTLRYAMIDILSHPPKELEAVIKAHFRLRKQAILDTTQTWIDDAQKWNVLHANHLTQLREQFSALLNKL